MYLIKQEKGFSCSGYTNFIPSDIEPESLLEVDDSVVAQLRKHELEWQNGELVSHEKTNEELEVESKLKEKRKQQNYEIEVERLIRAKYTVSQELAILRQRDTKTQEFSEYYDYAEQCKMEAKSKLL